MLGIDRIYCDFAIRTVMSAVLDLMQTPVVEVLGKQRVGKKDTLGMDAVPENSIRASVNDFFANAILVTEETDEDNRANWPEDPDPDKQPLMFFCDPMDRSAQFGQFLKTFPSAYGESELSLVGDIITHSEAKNFWAKEVDKISPIMISGATVSVTCVSKGKIIVSAIMNVMTQTIFVACSSGVFSMYTTGDMGKMRALLSSIDLTMIEKKGKRIIFDSPKSLYRTEDDFLRFASFTGKEGYMENLMSSGILTEDQIHPYHDLPGGPSRVLFLSDFQPNDVPVGFVLANGEKIGEWIHWLAYVKFAKNSQGDNILRIYEINSARLHAKDSILMSPPPPYSIFRYKSGSIVGPYLHISRLRDFDHPSHFRSMVLVTNASNMRVRNIMSGKGYNDVSSSF